MGDTEWLDWHGCYDEGWRGLIVDEAFAHPAKAARGLVRKIFAHMESQGWILPRSRVLDVFGGIGTTAIEGASRGHEVVCVELEERFFKLAKENFALHRRMWESVGDPLPVILNGDSRKAAELVRGYFAATVGSPPFSGTEQPCASQTHAKKDYRAFTRSKGTKRDATLTGDTPGQLGAMKEGGIDAAIGSPPYAETPITGQGNFQSAKCPNSKPARDARGDGYSDAVVGSPPYASGVVHNGNGIDQTKLTGNKAGKSTQAKAEGYGVGKDNLGNLSEGDVDSVVSSPPWENQEPSHAQGSKFVASKQAEGRSFADVEYGKANGQIGNSSGETFWLAARTILEQVHQLVKIDGVCAWIVKDYVKKGQRVPFCDNWARLCEATGFRVIQRARCHLVKEETNAGLFGDVTKKTERKSFFRRLHEKKPGAIRIDWEEVIFVVSDGRRWGGVVPG